MNLNEPLFESHEGIETLRYMSLIGWTASIGLRMYAREVFPVEQGLAHRLGRGLKSAIHTGLFIYEPIAL